MGRSTTTVEAVTVHVMAMQKFVIMSSCPRPMIRCLGNFKSILIATFDVLKLEIEVKIPFHRLCGNCREGNLTDCNNPGCIPTNGLERVVFTYNRQIPGPAIHVCKGDRIIVDVMNHLPGDETVIHWHGILQQKTPWMDGVQMVTQCPIPQGTTFRYDYEATDAGTFWYHSHSGVQRTDGLFGSLIIHDDDDANKKYYDCDYAEHTILVTDWINVLASYYTPGVRSNIIHPDSILINGHGTYQDPKTGNNTFAPIAVFYVPRGKRCLFRLINTGSQNCPSEFSVCIFLVLTSKSSIFFLAYN